MKPRTYLLQIIAITIAATSLPASAAVIYQQSFDTNTTDLLTTYGFNMYKSNNNAAGNPRVENGLGVWTGGASGPIGYDFKMWHDISSFAYDWSQPLTYSVDIGSQSGGGGQSYGLLLSSSTSQPTSGGLSYNFYWPSAGGGGWLGDGNASNRINNNTDPDVAAGTTLYTVGLTIRQNAGDAGKFDYMVTVNGTAQTTVSGSLPSGVTQSGDWYLGLSKATYGIAGADPFNAIGVRADGLAFNSYVDNISLTTIPEPSSSVLGLSALALLALRRKRR